MITDALLDEMAAKLVPRLERIADAAPKPRVQHNTPPLRARVVSKVVTAPAGAPQHWRVRAACTDHPHLDWLVEPGELEQQVCDTLCPVKKECYEAGNNEWGMWGGRMRRRIRAR